MQTVLILIHLMVVMAMIGVVLLQRSEGGGLGVGQAGGFLSSRGTANVLTRTTAILATAFFATSLALSIVAGINHKPQSILQNTGGPPAEPLPGPSTPSPAAPASGGGILDQLQKQGQPPTGQPPAGQPARPPGPQVPQSR
jgi:preprotein translocase subunit SecG